MLYLILIDFRSFSNQRLFWQSRSNCIRQLRKKRKKNQFARLSSKALRSCHLEIRCCDCFYPRTKIRGKLKSDVTILNSNSKESPGTGRFASVSDLLVEMNSILQQSSGYFSGPFAVKFNTLFSDMQDVRFQSKNLLNLIFNYNSLPSIRCLLAENHLP